VLLALLMAVPCLAESPPEAEGAPEISIVTKYITLTYPTDYAPDVVFDVAEEPAGCRITAIAAIDGTALELFSIVLSEAAAEGFRLGRLTAPDGSEAGIYLLMNEQRPEDWSPEAFGQINAWQESINILLMQIHENAGFTAGG